MNILIADDDRSSRILLAAQLRGLGHKVVCAHDGLTALSSLSSTEPPQIAILDWLMPGMDGLELCRVVRARNCDRYTYLILLTAKTLVRERVEGLDSGADDYIAKPVAPDELGARVRAGQRIISLHEDLLQAREQLRMQATHDSLTGLWNRGAILNILRTQSERSIAERRALGVLLCDVDHFKVINDTCGHLAGDAVLRIIAERLQRAVRQSDVVGRYGGEEFLVILPDCGEDTLADVAERVRLSVCMHDIAWSGLRIKASISIGATLQTSDRAVSIEGLIQGADTGLFTAKRAGRNRIVSTPSWVSPSSQTLPGRATGSFFAEQEM